MPMKLNVGDIVKLKKKHPCGGYEWEILRIGADFRIKCNTCERQVWLPRKEVERRITKIVSSIETEEEK
ncbi:DUF951 domain-containing protein [Sedimentibacter sp. MB31-C6]|uniref:DUF951 domain-containing protein n=1 Tax=Sedimentibacter sp. MB31-C6 TaxID=3109366 RepID=UPI002DDC9F37|nr:DUF951 domain-containing protein [Sedimentibacter sp. MB36-C1]WSI05478.1 DUF951 domain-containing protein [Sedimentibacter sp. MB36-C1]